MRKAIDHILPKTWRATQFCKISAKRAHLRLRFLLSHHHALISLRNSITLTPVAFTVDARFFDGMFDAILHLNVVDNDSIVCFTRETVQEKSKEDVMNENKGEVIESLRSHHRPDE